MALSALGVDGALHRALSRTPAIARSAIHTLIEFKALGVTPEWIGGFARIGYADIPADELVQLHALEHHARSSSPGSIASATATCR